MTAAAAKVLRHIASGIESGLAQPMNVNLYTPDVGRFLSHHLGLRLADNAADQMAGWVEWLGLGPVRIGDVLGEGHERRWRSYKAEGLWQGWQVDVWSAVDEPAEAEQAEVPECICDDSNLPARRDCPYCYPGGAA